MNKTQPNVTAKNNAAGTDYVDMTQAANNSNSSIQ